MSLESSLAVDPADDAEHCTVFGDLQPEIQAEIFNYFKPMERQKLKAICRSWDYVIGQLFETELRMTEPLQMFETKARFLYVGFISCAGHKLYRGTLFISFCSRIHNLTLAGVNLSSNFMSILRNCSLLQRLVIDQIQFSKTNMKLPTKAEKLEQWLPKLRLFRFYSSGYDDSEAFLLNFLAKVLETGKLEALHVTTKQRVDNFDFLDREFVMGSGGPGEISRPVEGLVYHAAINKIISTNQRTLRTINVESLQFPDSNYKNICIDTYPLQSGTSKVHVKGFTAVDTLLLPNLEPSPWLKILTRQKYLKELALTSFDRATLFSWNQDLAANIILRNYATLTLIDLDFATTVLGHLPTWDAEVFSTCNALKQLELRLWPMRAYNYYVIAGQIPTITNIEKLPSSIEHLTTNFTISSPAARFNQIPFENFKNLKTLQLFGIPWFSLNGTHVPALTLKEYGHLATKLTKCKAMYLMLNSYGKFNQAGNWKAYKTLSPGVLKKSKKNMVLDGEIFVIIANPSKQPGTNQVRKQT